VKNPADAGAPGTVFLDGMQQWFDSVWKHLAQ
jgi:hypothetical protein